MAYIRYSVTFKLFFIIDIITLFIFFLQISIHFHNHILIHPHTTLILIGRSLKILLLKMRNLLLLLRFSTYKIGIDLAINLRVIFLDQLLHFVMFFVVEVVVRIPKQLFTFINKNLIALTDIRLTLLLSFQSNGINLLLQLLGSSFNISL